MTSQAKRLALETTRVPFLRTAASIFMTAVHLKQTRVIESITAALSETTRVFKSMTAVPSETTRVIQSMTAVLSKKTPIRALNSSFGCFDAILGVIFFAASLASYMKIFACLFRGLSSIRTPFPSCGFVQRRLWVGALEISGDLSTSIGCPATPRHDDSEADPNQARREAGSKENLYGGW